MSTQPTPERLDQVAPDTCTRSEFARRNGWAKSYITKLADQGRIVFTDDGKLVQIAATLARIAETTGAPERASSAVVPSALQELQLAEKRLDVLRKEREEAVEMGRLVVASEVIAVQTQILSALRGKLENWPDLLAPQLAGLGGNEGRIRALLTQHVDASLQELHRRFAKLAADMARAQAD